MSMFKTKAQLSGKYIGTVADFTVSKLQLRTGGNSVLTGTFSMKGLPKIETTQIKLQQGFAQSNYKDLAQARWGFTRLPSLLRPGSQSLRPEHPTHCPHQCSARAAQDIKGHHRPVIASTFPRLQSFDTPIVGVVHSPQPCGSRPHNTPQKVSFVIAIKQTNHSTN